LIKTAKRRIDLDIGDLDVLILKGAKESFRKEDFVDSLIDLNDSQTTLSVYKEKFNFDPTQW